MQKIIDFYFDFQSPYSCLACSQIGLLSAKYEGVVTFRCHSIDLWAARIEAGNTSPPNRDQQAKAAACFADIARWAKRYGIPMKPPASLARQRDRQSERLNRGFIVANERGAGIPFIGIGARKVWGEGGDPDDPALLKAAAEEAGLDGDAVVAEADSARVGEIYASENREAQARGIFGTPIFVIDKEVFWGNDRIEFLEEYIHEHTGGTS